MQVLHKADKTGTQALHGDDDAIGVRCAEVMHLDVAIVRVASGKSA